MNSTLAHVTGDNQVVFVEGDTDRIFLEALRNQKSFLEPDYVQIGGIGELEKNINLLIKSSVFLSIPAIKVLVDCDNANGRFNDLKNILKAPELVEGEIREVTKETYRQGFRPSDTVKVGGMLLRGKIAADLEGLIAECDSVDVGNFHNVYYEKNGSNAHETRCYSKRLRFFERSINPEILKDASYFSLYGPISGIDFDSSGYDSIVEFMNLA